MAPNNLIKNCPKTLQIRGTAIHWTSNSRTLTYYFESFESRNKS